MRSSLKVALVALFLGLVWPGVVMAAPALVADLSRDDIKITTSFTGTRLLLFGATEGTGDVVVVVRGPDRQEVIRKKQRIGGIWVNGESVTFDRVPGYYFEASSRPLSQIASRDVLRKHQIGAGTLPLFAQEGTPSDRATEYRSALLRLKQNQSLYASPAGPVKIMGERLFRVELVFPSSVPTGTYGAQIFLFKNGRPVSVTRKTLVVRKTGIEAAIFEFAHQHAAVYGICAILIALFAGWLAGVIFRKV